MFKPAMAVAATIALVATPVQATCWKGDEASAAQVRNLQSMLMVAALRCQVAKFDITSDYNEFVKSNRIAIQGMNDKLKAHFIRARGPVAGQTEYDRFTTTLANGFGAAASGAEICASAASLAREGAMMAGSIEGLLTLAAREGIATSLPDGTCEPTMSVAQAGVPKPMTAPARIAAPGAASTVMEPSAAADAPAWDAATSPLPQ